MDEAEYLGAKAVAFLAGKWEEAAKDEAYAQLLKTTVNLCRYAETKGMGVNLEVFDYDIDKAALIGPAPLAARFAADVRCSCPNFGLLVDLSHFPLTYEKSEFVIRTLRPYIRHLHIGNAVVPVSYTHLDVYKRQPVSRAGHAADGEIPESTGDCGLHQRKLPQRRVAGGNRRPVFYQQILSEPHI